MCYDVVGDAAQSLKGCGGTFEACVNHISSEQERYCTFFDLPSASVGGIGGPWLWIIILIILLILIAAIVWWYRQKQRNFFQLIF